MPQSIYQVDAFVSDKRYSGNPAAVCILEKPGDPGWMQAVAMEMNLAETAFLVPQQDGFDLRWFTPEVEIALCGHATLASAHILWETGRLKPNQQARFHSMSGLLTADRKGEIIELDFPSKPEVKTAPPPELLLALGITPVYVGKNEFDYIVEVESEKIVREMNPDHLRLKNIPVRGIIVTSRSSSKDYDFVSRFLAPGSGVPEDPVTGSAHCCLGPFWQQRLSKNVFSAYQASPRGGVLSVRVEGNRVHIGGKAITTLRGELL